MPSGLFLSPSLQFLLENTASGAGEADFTWVLYARVRMAPPPLRY